MPLSLTPLSLHFSGDDVLSYKIEARAGSPDEKMFDVRVIASSGYEISIDGENFYPEITVTPNPGQRPPRISRSIYVKKVDPAGATGTVRHIPVGGSEKEAQISLYPATAPPPPPHTPPSPPPLPQTPSIALSTHMLDFGKVKPGGYNTKTFTIRTKDVKGDIDIQVAAPYSLSAGSNNFQPGIMLPVKGDGDQKVFVRYQPPSEGSHTAKLSLAFAGKSAGNVDLTGVSKRSGRLTPVLLGLAVVALIGILIWLFRSQTPPDAQKTYLLRLVGSNTIGDSLMQNLVTAYLKDQLHASEVGEPRILEMDKGIKEIDAVLNGKKVTVRIEAPGSAFGFPALRNGTADIAMASRKIKGDELDSFRNQTTPENLSTPGCEHVIGLDGIALIVSPENPIQQYTLDQLKRIFTGQDHGYHLFVGDSKSGTTDGFRTMVGMKKTDGFANDNVDSFASYPELMERVASTANGIGYISFSFVAASSRVKVVPIAGREDNSPTLPGPLTIKSEDYALCRELNLYIHPNNPNNPQIEQFVHFVEDAGGQQIVEKMGFINLEIKLDTPDKRFNDPLTYTNLINNYDKLSSDIRFKIADNTLDSRAIKDIDRIVGFMSLPANRDKRVLLVGFADSVGTYEKNFSLSRDRAHQVDSVLNQHGIGKSPSPANEVIPLGPARPIRNNTTVEERTKNRRVEVWISR